MSLRPPRLDDRRYADLRQELIRRIPVHAPEWTDHNPADPGITLLELFAELGETLLERFNQVPEAARLAFLQLLGIDPRLAQVATALVKLELPPRASSPLLVPWGPFEPRLELAAGEVPFQAVEEITVLPLELQTWLKQPLSRQAGAGLDAANLRDLSGLLERHLQLPCGTVNLRSGDTYEAVPLAAVQEGLLPPPISTMGTVDGWLWLALLAPQPLLAPASAAADLDRLRRNLAEQVLSLGVRVDAALCGPTDHLRCPDSGAPTVRWPLQWELSTGRFLGREPRVNRLRYERLEVVHDGTEGFRHSGTVRLRLPALAADGTPAFGNWTAESFSPADADLLGVGELPPPLENERDAARVLGWIRVRRRNPAHPPLKVRWLEVNVLPVEQAVTASAPEALGFGDGRSGLELSLSQRPVLPGSEDVQVWDGAAWLTWRPVADLTLAGPDDPFYRLDAEAGTIRFGDGVHGRIPLPGQAIRCRTYRYGGGVAGNVGAGRVKRILSGSAGVLAANLKVANPLAASGGADAETTAAASDRLSRVLRHNDRAVGRDDFADLALETPGAGIGRAHCLPRHLPHERVDEVPGVVTLIVIPAYDPLHPDEPVPDRDQLRRVCAWMEPRRLVTTELYVTPPTYVRLSVSVGVEAEPGVGEETLRRSVELALRQVLAPLPPFGPDGRGWPFGRDVGERDLEAAVLRVQGVRLVTGVLLGARPVDVYGRAAASTQLQRLPLANWQLPSLREVRVVISEPDADPTLVPPLEPLPPPEDEPIPPGTDSGGGSSGGGGSTSSEGGTPLFGGIPVPVVREVC